ncbi:hypothetical protein DDZ13_05595 [Coraliomargarita sinensis]|uniref:PEP-CTERM protein-sorting domain-containing protein n=1 Tax=Coraliomargarita sinensis TaxID=2174842 RepID=A0A317ZGF7_9BACT|nr:PEP-CTERM sorting domain-containing protein [Coraliomargarita sinensis]PXA04646.1 hypothetical protein DDZ13_05595 [Coraliomargarita sinensis]
MNIVKSFTITVGALFAAAAGLQAQSVISINFDNGGNPITGSTGAVNAGSWNTAAFGAAGSPVTTSNLLFDDGTASITDISLSNRLNGTPGGNDQVLPGATGEMLNLYTERNRNDGARINITDITFSQYDVYLYYGSVFTEIVVNGVYQGSYLDNDDGSSFVEGSPTVEGNYARFSGLSGSTLEILTALDGDGNLSGEGFVFGAQIVAVPEPSAFALLAGMVGLTWVMVRRRA